MEQTELINKAAGLINQASERSGTGFPDEAKARLADLWELLNNQRYIESGGVDERPAPPPPPGG